MQTVENVACILRNLSYRLENEIDPQEGADDVLDREWEMEQRREIEELDRSFAKAAPGCFAFLTRPRRRDNTLRINTPAALNRPIYNIDFANPGKNRFLTVKFTLNESHNLYACNVAIEFNRVS